MFQDFIGKASAKLEQAKGQVATALNKQINNLFTTSCTPIPFDQKFQITPNVKRSEDVSHQIHSLFCFQLIAILNEKVDLN